MADNNRRKWIIFSQLEWKLLAIHKSTMKWSNTGFKSVGFNCFEIVYLLRTFSSFGSDSYNPVPGVMQGVPSSRNYEGGFTSKLMVVMHESFL